MIEAGTHIGSFEVVGELGRGGMATLYLARERGPGGGYVRDVAIKVMHRQVAGDLEVRKMFVDEARLSACIRHPNVVRVEASDEHEGWPYLVMEHIHGATLAQMLRAHAEMRAPLPVDVAVAIAAQIAGGLHAAHESTDEIGRPLGIVHRDVSPSNVLVDHRGHVKLIDFGIARARTRLAKTMPGCVKGKLAYMSPEQLEGAHFDRRVDVFALGIVVWEMLALRRLFYASTDVETIMRIRDPAPVAPPSTHRPDVPPRLDDVIGTMLARDLEERFSTAAAARHAMLLACPGAVHVDADTIATFVVEPAAARQDDGEATAPARPGARPPTQ